MSNNCYAECHLCSVAYNPFMLSVVILCVVMLCVVMLCVVMLCVVMLFVVMLLVFVPSLVMLSVIMLSLCCHYVVVMLSIVRRAFSLRTKTP
jgi:hypothetical protein